ncbi:MAG: hypothetical protein JXA21_26455, partial [Anaerolineae bacterium]|nr:hypothetical protein [Anaerolineae bacterium]
MPEALPSELEQRLRAALLRCGPFDSDSSLRAIFVDARIAAWRDDIPDNTPSRGKRVAAFIEGLLDQRDNAGNNALALVLHVLADRTPPGDSCHRELAELANAVQNAVIVVSGSPPPPLTPLSAKYEIHVHGGQIGAIGDNAKIEGGIHFGSGDAAQKTAATAVGDTPTALRMARRALAILEEQAAGYTALTIPVHLKI